MRQSVQAVWIVAGWVSLAVGAVGAFVPLLPTTPLVILAAFCFSRGSPRVHGWLLRHRWLGPPVADWERHGVIRPRAKRAATVAIVTVFALTLLLVDVPWPVKVAVAATGLAVLAFIWSRPASVPDTAGAPAPEASDAPDPAADSGSAA